MEPHEATSGCEYSWFALPQLALEMHRWSNVPFWIPVAGEIDRLQILCFPWFCFKATFSRFCQILNLAASSMQTVWLNRIYTWGWIPVRGPSKRNKRYLGIGILHKKFLVLLRKLAIEPEQGCHQGPESFIAQWFDHRVLANIWLSSKFTQLHKINYKEYVKQYCFF